jgi:hypothetical protein
MLPEEINIFEPKTRNIYDHASPFPAHVDHNDDLQLVLIFFARSPDSYGDCGK